MRSLCVHNFCYASQVWKQPSQRTEHRFTYAAATGLIVLYGGQGYNVDELPSINTTYTVEAKPDFWIYNLSTSCTCTRLILPCGCFCLELRWNRHGMSDDSNATLSTPRPRAVVQTSAPGTALIMVPALWGTVCVTMAGTVWIAPMVRGRVGHCTFAQ
jgi:hypothetical protein